ncbi:hypothetical protein HHL28_09520 [Aerophototrophica crusticola]|uniref:DUF3718 domain-containing protein n=1 Tax=Aerophototrophica crusticola TaxID=1709002 RepID=A0A858R8E4_9PROT|nr:hypothetical protein HHL28_09520 [Rhodospirillaceae bacterium B3]
MLRLAIAAAIALAVSSPALAQEAEPKKDKGITCIPLRDIDRTETIDSKTILVKLRGKDRYQRISLANRCTGLLFNGFSFATSTNDLCSTDPLRVVEPGSQFCLIDSIDPITAEQADALRMAKK